MRPMIYAIQQLRRMRAWHVVYAIFVVLALAGATDGRAEDEADPERTLAPPAEIPLSEVEEPRITLGVAKQVSRNWAVSFDVWTAL